MKNRLSQVVLFIWLSLLLSSNVFAEIIADVTANANKQPTVKTSSSGVTYVNIQAPNSSGLSHNVYSKFDVERSGVVLNNSATDVQTKLAGWIEGNKALGSSAKTILNEVNSNDKSLLRGFIEVAGSKANVIIANPNGIMVDGAGFINVNRGVLTTGVPIINNGSMDGYRVSNGSVDISGDGLNGNESDYTDIIARTVNLHSKVWAKNLNIISGANDVSLDTNTVTPNSSSAPIPVYAIDTGALGGMYAGKIRLVATEAGVGVRNNGEISATSELIISANGKLENASKIYSKGSIAISAASDVINTDTIYSLGSTNIDTNATLSNSGLVASYGNLSAKANTISNKLGATMAAGLDENASVSKSDSTLGLKAVSIDNKADLLASNISIGDGSGTIDNTGTINAISTYINLQNLNNKVGGKIYGDSVAISAVNLTNYSTIASRNDLNIGVANILNKDDALIYTLGNMYIGGALDTNKLATGRATTLTNSSATIESMGMLGISADSIVNTNNNFAYEWIVDYALSGQSKSLGGNSYANYTETHYKPNITHTSPAQLKSAGDMALDTNTLTNYQSSILSGGNLAINANTIDNQAITAQQPIIQSGTQYIWQVTGRSCHGPWYNKKCSDDWGYVAYGYNATYYESVTIDNATRQSNTNGTLLKTIDNPNVTPSVISIQNTDPAAKYLIEIDPQFADKGKWLSSDFMLSKLSYDPAYETKRFGDGYNEQKLITQQIGQLTGKRFLSGYNDDNAQFQALMDNALNQASSLHLKIGASLSAAQVAALSSDIVWMVEKSVTLPNGQTQNALVPQVYLASNSVSLTPQGALISANDTAYVNASGSVTNSGVIKSGNATYVLAKDVANKLGEIGSGGVLAIASANDITNTLGTFSSKGDMSLSADRDININGATVTSGSNMDMTASNNINVSTVTTNKSYATIKETNNIASNITAAKNLSATSGANITASGANITADAANLTAVSGNVELRSVKDLQTSSYAARNHTYSSSDETIKGATINTRGNLNIVAANTANKTNAGNILVSSSTINSANGATNLTSAKDTTITGDKELHTEYDKRVSSSKGTFSSKTTTTITNNASNTQVGSTVSGDSVNIASNQKIDIIASNVVATKDATLSATDNINITAGKNEHLNQSFSETKKSGFFSSGGLGITYGTQSTSLSQTTQGYTQSDAKSTVGSIEGNVNIASNKEVAVKGSDIVAPKDLTISGSNVAITTGVDTVSQSEVQQIKTSGLTLSLSSGTLNLAQSVATHAKQATKTTDARSRQLNAVVAGLQGVNAYDSGKAIGNAMSSGAPTDIAAAAGIKVSLSYGSSSSKSESNTNTLTNTQSNALAGENLNITSTKDNIDIVGSKVAANNIALSSAKDVNIESAQDTFSNRSNNSSSSSSVGVSVSATSKGLGVSLDVSASRAKGYDNTDSVANLNSVVSAKDTLTITSNNDTNIKGALLSADSVKANIGGNLNVESRQDTMSAVSKQSSSGFSVSIPVYGPGNFGASVSMSKTNANADYKSVVEQTAIKAGDGGFDIKVAKDTTLKGATISSSDKAVENNKNSLTTATLTTSDIQNSTSANADTSGYSLSTDMFTGKYAAVKGVAQNLLNNGKASTSDSSVAKSAVSKSNITITDEARQKALTGKTAKQTAQSVNTNTSDTNKALVKADIEAVKQKAKDEQALKMLAYEAVTAITDEAHNTMFAKNAKLVKIAKDKDGKQIVQEVSDSEKANLQKDENGKVRISDNGIFNDEKAAVKYASQHASGDAPVYAIIFPQANNILSELAVAGYQKYMEGDTLGLANATQLTKDILKTYGQSGLEIDAHSRGSLTFTNAAESIKNEPNSKGALSNTYVNFYGPAQNVANADSTVSYLQNRDAITDPTQKTKMSIQYQAHAADPIGTIIGLNPSTGGTIPSGSSVIWEGIRAATGQENTAHNLYYKDASNFQPTTKLQQRIKLINDYWGGQAPKLVPAIDYTAQGGGK